MNDDTTQDTSEFERAFEEMAGKDAAVDEGPAQGELAAQDAEPMADKPEQEAEAQEAAHDMTPQVAPADAKPRMPRLADLVDFVPEDRREQYRQFVGGIEADLQRLRSDDGRVAAYQQRYTEAKSRAEELQTKLQALETKPVTATTSQQQQDAKDELDELAQEFPELSKQINIRFEKLIQRLAPQPAQPPAAATEPDRSTAKPQPAVNADVEDLAREYAALQAAHPDYKQVSGSPEFVAWIKSQPTAVVGLAGSNRAADAIYVMDTFKADRQRRNEAAAAAKKQADRQRLAASVGVRSTPSRAATPPDDFESAFEFYASRS